MSRAVKKSSQPGKSGIMFGMGGRGKPDTSDI